MDRLHGCVAETLKDMEPGILSGALSPKLQFGLDGSSDSRPGFSRLRSRLTALLHRLVRVKMLIAAVRC